MNRNEYRGPAAQLLELGRPIIGKWPDYTAMGIGASEVPELIRLVQDDVLLTEASDDPEYYAPIHAWRALSQLRDPAALAPLVQALDRAEDSDWAMEELPVVLARFGPPAIPALGAYLADTTRGMFPRAAASAALVHIASDDDAQRTAVLFLLAGVVADFEVNDPGLTGLVIGDLLDLRAVEAAAVMEQAFAANAVDPLMNGDWEDVQVELGLLPARLTPKRAPWRDMLAGWDPGPSPPPAAAGGSGRSSKQNKSRKKMARRSRRSNRRR